MNNEYITKKSAIDIVHRTIYNLSDKEDNFTEKDKILLTLNKEICTKIDNFTPLTLKKKQGHWVYGMICSECKYIKPFGKYNYCPKCGVEMEDNENDE